MKKNVKLGSKPVNLGLARQFKPIDAGSINAFFPPSTFGNKPRCEVRNISSNFGCCHHYEVWCDGAHQWTGGTLCDETCLTATSIILHGL